MLLIFDCDGVLRSFSWEGIFAAYREISIDLCGKDLRQFFENINYFKEWFSTDWQINLRRMGIEDADFPKAVDIFHRVYDPRIETFHWVGEIFEELSVRGHNIVVLSASSTVSVKKSLNSSAKHVSLFIGSEDVSKIKPDPEGIHLAMKEFPHFASDSLMIGDTEMDVIAGKSAGVLTGAVDWGMRRIGNYLVDLDPDHVFHSPSDFLSIGIDKGDI